MERRKKRVKGAISVEKLSIGKTENSLESVKSFLYLHLLFVNVDFGRGENQAKYSGKRTSPSRQQNQQAQLAYGVQS